MSFSDSLDRSLAKVRDLQSTSTLEQFMSKLCLHHQRQIVDALGFLQTEVKAVAASCCTEQSAPEAPAETDCSPVLQEESADFPCTGQRAVAATAAASRNASLETANLPNASLSVLQLTPERAGATDSADEVYSSQTRSDPLDLRKSVPGDTRGSSFLFSDAKCEFQPPNRIFRRRNARKSTRGHAYIEECCELKTVRTLAGKPGTSDKGNCPAPVLENNSSVTPKPALSKPESVPPVDIPFAGGCGETFGQKAMSEQLMEKEIVGDDVAVVRDSDLIPVETSQTGQPPFREQTPPHAPVLSSLVGQQTTETETEGEGGERQEEGEKSQSEEPLAPCFDKEVVQADKNKEDDCGDQLEMKVAETVQPEDDLPDPAAAADEEAGDEAAGPSAEMDRLKVPNRPAHPKEKPATTSVEREIPGDSKASVGNTLEKCRKMPLAREKSNSGMSTKPMSSATLMKHKKVVLRSQRSATLLASGAKEESEQNRVDCGIKARVEKSSQSQKRDLDPFGVQKLDLSAPNPPKFLQALRGEEHQQQIASLNSKYDKMQRGWVQLDKEGQPAPRHRNKADRLKEIWKSKRRIRKPRPLDQQKYSPVQMLFMKTFDLTSICRWFLQTTETKSLVIVKKVNTRLPSETQLCFHSSSVGSSHGVFPSLQAERLKKHLKKFAIASPVKSNARNQKLIAKAWEQDGLCSKGKEKIKELTSATRISTKPYSHPCKPQTQAVESQKAVATVKSPASARILRKYSNIREKLHVQQHALKPKEIESVCVKPSISPKPVSKPKASTEQGKKIAPAERNSVKEPHASKNMKADSLSSSKRDALKKVVKQKGSRSSCSGTSLKILGKKDPKLLKRVPAAPRPRKAPARSPAASRLKRRAVVPTRASRLTGMQRARLVKAVPQKAADSKVHLKTPLRSKVLESAAVQPQRPEALPSPSQDQVLTRSQRKIEATPSTSGASKPATKRTQELTPTPAKRTRTSLLK
ncbi:hypothetical protein AAFF_G00138340 [Aldrovandia affinis]|uniref:Uncharacterized protein n=1 Tax=Aldrovandia affinis TaxID=143900 RepID=A0AAD7X2Q3_9TELE|nr:hypothetical protein AAFF_G00138340 [Aldrovandia affinis]